MSVEDMPASLHQPITIYHRENPLTLSIISTSIIDHYCHQVSLLIPQRKYFHLLLSLSQNAKKKPLNLLFISPWFSLSYYKLGEEKYSLLLVLMIEDHHYF